VQYALHWGCGSIICPVPFPSRLITPHTSTATAVVNNTMFTPCDATRLVAQPIRPKFSANQHLSDVSHRISGRQMTYSPAVRPVGWDRRGKNGWAEDLDARDRRRPLRSRCNERSPRHIAGPSCWPNGASGEGTHRGRAGGVANSACIHVSHRMKWRGI